MNRPQSPTPYIYNVCKKMWSKSSMLVSISYFIACFLWLHIHFHHVDTQILLIPRQFSSYIPPLSCNFLRPFSSSLHKFYATVPSYRIAGNFHKVQNFSLLSIILCHLIQTDFPIFNTTAVYTTWVIFSFPSCARDRNSNIIDHRNWQW